ncbi:MAG: DNA polymerase III subunit delta [Rhodospirillaceae bacterium]|nr:DNA polymerase III subunit delta [Rhodospirillaceae bacterium]|tara:strand:- start:492 stop:1517 length:1026 start_codon:yes stop_codon:yes gene_type:complete
MKVFSNKADAFIKSIPDNIFGVLFYGPNKGLVSIRSQALKKFWAGDNYDPFDVVQLDSTEIIKDLSIFLNHISSMSFSRNRQVIIISNSSDKLTKVLKELDFSIYIDKKIILVSDELSPRSSLRKYFEGDDFLASIPCYEDSLTDNISFVQRCISDKGLVLSNTLIKEIANYLSNDRLINFQELTKLFTYINDDSSKINSDLLNKILSTSSNTSIENISYAVGSGQKNKLIQNINSAFRIGTNPISIIRGTAYHLERILFIKQQCNANVSISESMSNLKPKIFFKREAEFINQVNNWSVESIILSLRNLLFTELACKKYHFRSNFLCERSLLSISSRFSKK